MQLIKLYYENNEIHYSDTTYPLEDVLKVFNSCFLEKMTIELLKEFSNVCIFTLYEKELPIGMFWLERKTRDVSFMTSFAIIPSHQRKGIGSKLFQCLPAIINSTDIECILFDVQKENKGSVAFYETQKNCKKLDVMNKCVICSVKGF